ncbi:granulocyte colony-stimulating factor [Rhynochetos jubatus]
MCSLSPPLKPTVPVAPAAPEHPPRSLPPHTQTPPQPAAPWGAPGPPSSGSLPLPGAPRGAAIPGDVLVLLLWVPWRVLDAAPLVELSGDLDFQLFLQKNLEFTRKIQRDLESLKDAVCHTFQLCEEKELLLVQQDLGIAQAPLERCHRRAFQPEACFSQIRDGLRTYHGSLAAVLELLPGHAGLVETLQLDAANLSSNIQKQMEDLGLATVSYPMEHQSPLPTFSSRFHHQVGGFFIVVNFQRFLETAYRALRHLTRL